jgi:type VI secretion system secreted protein VgrG
MTLFLQQRRLLAVDTPLGPDRFLLTDLFGDDPLSGLFSLELGLLAQGQDVAPETLLGQKVSVRLGPGAGLRFSGYVSRFVVAGREGDFRRCRATVVPWLWFLTRTADCRTFHERTVPEIFEAVCKDLGFTDYRLDLREPHPRLPHCVLYRETAFNALSRLLEHEGISYWFEHAADGSRHTLVLADHAAAHPRAPSDGLHYDPAAADGDPAGRVFGWEHRYDFIPGRWVLSSHSHEQAGGALRASADSRVPLKGPGAGPLTVFDHPGDFRTEQEGRFYARLRREESDAGYHVVYGASTCPGLRVGHKFTLARHPCPAEVGKTYVITSVHHHAVEPAPGSSEQAAVAPYSNTFTCIPEGTPFRPPRRTPKPQLGPQTARVIGADGEKIATDRYASTAIRYFWEHHARDGANLAWARTEQQAAGPGDSAVSLPRVDAEVLVAHVDGDPDRPVIQGQLYNADRRPAHALPQARTQTYRRVTSTPDGDGHNECRVENAKGREEIAIRAARDFKRVVGHDDVLEVAHDLLTTVREGNESKRILKGGSTLEAQQAIELRVGGCKLRLESGSLTLEVGRCRLRLDASGITLEGPVIKAEAQALAQLKAAVTKILADGLLQAKGGITTINS